MALTKVDYSLISHCLEKNLVFAAFCLPGRSTFTLIIQRSSNPDIIDSLRNIESQQGFIISPFDTGSEHKTVLIKDDVVWNENDSVAMPLIEPGERIPESARKKSSPYVSSKDEYVNQLSVFLKELQSNKLQKVVLSRIIEEPNEGDIDHVNLFRSINNAYPDAFTYLVNTPETGTWMGATPEQLLKIEGDNAYTVALAGTQKHNNLTAEKIRWGEKETIEQVYVVDYIDSLLDQYYDKSEIIKDTYTAIAGEIAHLKTAFEFPSGRIRERLGHFIEKLHPTPAVCGLPEEEALNLIKKTEIHDREYYSGFLGPVNIDGNSDIFVNLRCLKILEERFALFTGGGITIDSQAESEWEETKFKAETLLSIIYKQKKSLKD